MIRNRLTGVLAAMGLHLATAGLAQAYEASLVVAQIKVTQSGAKNYVVESLVVVVLMGVAVFTICKSSRRS